MMRENELMFGMIVFEPQVVVKPVVVVALETEIGNLALAVRCACTLYLDCNSHL